jgi:hypothetical protein
MAMLPPRSSRRAQSCISNPRRGATDLALRLILLLFVGLWAFCHQASRKELPGQAMPRKDINAVLRAHDQELMQMPGVVGIYVGLLDDGATPCLKVMVERKTPELERKIPKSLEGYPVVLDETGIIRPMQKK